MFLIDQYAYTNKLKDVHPVEKVLFSLLTMGIATASGKIEIHVIIIFLMAVSTVKMAGIPLDFYMKLLLLPFSFVILGILPILLEVSASTDGFSVSITRHGIDSSLIAVFRSVTAVASLYFMSLTTPMLDIIQIFKKIKVPDTIIEIMSLIYRFIFVLIESSMVIYSSQSSRLGYSSLSSSFVSMGKLVSMVFIKAYKHSQALYLSLVSRGYSGAFNVIHKEYCLNTKNITFIIAVEALLIALAYTMGGS